MLPLPVTNIPLKVSFPGVDMKILAPALAFLCLFATVSPLFAEQVAISDVPGWSTSFDDRAKVRFYYCESPERCGEGSIVSLSLRNLPPPTKSEIWAKYKNQNLPIKCKKTKFYESCEYPAAIDKIGRPTHYRPIPAEGFTADFFHCGYMYRPGPLGSSYKFLLTIVSSGENYQVARKNYKLFQTLVSTPPSAR